MGIHFLRPYWFLAILPLCYFVYQLAKSHLVDNWYKVVDRQLVAPLMVNPKHRFHLPLWLLAAGAMLSIIALAGPSWHQETQPIYRTAQGTVLVLNLSPSMSDTMGTTHKIDRARYKMLDYLKLKREGLTGLVVYNDEAYVISPLTEDTHTIANFIPVLDPTIMPTFKDSTPVALQEAEKLLKQGSITRGNIILITDKITQFSAAKSMAAKLAQEGYRLNIYAITNAENEEFSKLAVAGDGSVIQLTPDNSDIQQLLASTKIRGWEMPKKNSKEKGLFWHDDGRWLLVLILPLALLGFRRGYL